MTPEDRDAIPPEFVLDEDGYPTDGTLATITAWPVKTFADCEALLSQVQTLWRWDSYFKRGPARRVRGQPTWQPRRYWRVSTGGWSGHEDMLAAMEDNHPFWALCSYSWRRGGHYVFETRDEA